MATMDTKQLRDDVAVRVMGWTLREMAWAYSDRAELWYDDDGTALTPRHAWRPDEDESQLAATIERMLALGFELQLSSSARTTRARFRSGDEDVGHARSDDRRIAVLTAALAAIDRSS